MVASDEVDKIDNFWHKRFWKLLDLRDRNFSNCHSRIVTTITSTKIARSIDVRLLTLKFSGGDRTDYVVSLVLSVRSPLHDWLTGDRGCKTVGLYIQWFSD